MKKNRFYLHKIRIFIIAFAILTLSNCKINKDLKLEEYKGMISCELIFESPTFLVDENFKAWIEITNVSNQIIFIENSPLEWIVKGNRIKNFDIKFIDDQSRIEIIPMNHEISTGGRFGYIKLAPKENLRISIHKSKILKIKKVGSYKMNISKSVSMKTKKGRNGKYKIIKFDKEATASIKIDKQN